ncbi:MAG TPA: MFS transporter [Rhabdochlamydiaceae bacterium]|nr:MFS transporter [Rhabdochlamydiaceae bacterium]
MLPTLIFTVFLDSLGFGLVFPIFSSLIVHEGVFFSTESSLALRGLILGLLISSYCLGQFFGGPILGAMSDRKGRKKILMMTLWIASFGYLLSGVGILIKSLLLLFVARILNGIAAGNYAIAQSVIADTSKEKEKSKNFALLAMAWGTGFVVGPYLGGKLTLLGYTAPFLLSAFLCMLNLVLVLWKLKETRDLFAFLIQKKVSVFAGMQHLKKALQLSEFRAIFLVMFVFSLGWGFFTEFSPIFLNGYFELNVEQIGNSYAWLGLWIALSQGFFIRPLLKKYASETLLSIALFCLALVLLCLLLLEDSTNLVWMIPLIAFSVAFISPSAATIVSNLSAEESQGKMLGIYNSVQQAAIGISPLFSGSLVALYPHLPITVGGVCMFFAFLLLIWDLWKKKFFISEEL